MHPLTCGISSLLHFVNLILFTLLMVHLILHISPHHSHHLRSHHLSLPRPFTPDLKLISFINAFLHSYSCSFRTAFTDLNLYWIKVALVFFCFSFFFLYFFLAVCARLSWILSFWVHVKLFYRIVSWLNYLKVDVRCWTLHFLLPFPPLSLSVLILFPIPSLSISFVVFTTYLIRCLSKLVVKFACICLK